MKYSTQALLLSLASAQTWSANLDCTMNAYEGAYAQLGKSLDNSPAWCGIRYSVLNVARIVSLPNMDPSKCNQCIEIVGTGPLSGPSVYVLAVDQRVAYGLDIAESSYHALFPSDNILNPHVCKYRAVNPSLCGKICYGSAEECTVGVRNLLPASLLPAAGQAPIGLYNNNAPAPTTTTSQPKVLAPLYTNPDVAVTTKPTSPPKPIQTTVATVTTILTTTRPTASATTVDVFGSNPNAVFGVVSGSSRLKPFLSVASKFFFSFL